MGLTADQQRVKSLLTETVTLLCKNGLHFQSEFSIEGLIGITLDNQDVFLVSIKETISAPGQLPNSKRSDDDAIKSRRAHGKNHFVAQQHLQRRSKQFEVSAARRRPFAMQRQTLNSEYVHSNSRGASQNPSSESNRFGDNVNWESSSPRQQNSEEQNLHDNNINKSPSPSHSLGIAKLESYTKDWNPEVTGEHSKEGDGAGSSKQKPSRKRQRVADSGSTDCVESGSRVNLEHGGDDNEPDLEDQVVERDRRNQVIRKYSDVAEQPTEETYNSDRNMNDVITIKEEAVNDDEDGKSPSRLDDYMTYLTMCGVQADTQAYQALESSTSTSSIGYRTSTANTNSMSDRGRSSWSSAPRSSAAFTSNCHSTLPTASQVVLWFF